MNDDIELAGYELDWLQTFITNVPWAIYATIIVVAILQFHEIMKMFQDDPAISLVAMVVFATFTLKLLMYLNMPRVHYRKRKQP